MPELTTKANDGSLTIALIAVYIFIGFYHLFMFQTHKKALHNLFYGLFSTVLGIYFFMRTHTISRLIPDTALVTRIEYACLFLILPLAASFIENFCLKKIFKITKIYSAFYALLALAQFILPPSLVADAFVLWQLSLLIVIPIFCVCDLYYACISTRTFGLLVCSIICILTGAFDVLNSRFFHYTIFLSNYAFFVFTLSITLILAKRFGALYNQQERIITRSNKGMNAKLVDWIVVKDKDPHDLPSVNTDTAVMFTDIREFTHLTEGMSSKHITDFLWAINETLAQPLFAAEDRGIVAYTDKFMGDSMMNIFPDPKVALEIAVAFRKQLKFFNANPGVFTKDASQKVEVGTGIAFGPVTMGVMGHSRRLDYTPIGDTVNLASRIESLTKEYRTPILINDNLFNVVKSAGENGAFNLRHIDCIRVKGRNQPVDIYEEFTEDSPELRDFKLQNAALFRELQEMYFSGKNWKTAIRLTDELFGQGDEGSQGDFVPLIYRARMQNILSDPELFAQWDGVWTFTAK
jgi:class 3 adenylate cyclase